jgi:hypothetical protein
VREFRLARVALIPVVAGARKFVSIDVVFGEVDMKFAAIVEKHFTSIVFSYSYSSPLSIKLKHQTVATAEYNSYPQYDNQKTELRRCYWWPGL